jgi:UDPglucose--hexose-1-phosphate uridylyltransferase
MPEFRKDPIVDRWVIIAGERADRPQPKPQRAPTPDTGACPFCVGNESMTPPPVLVLPNDATADGLAWSVRVVPNKYPALTQDGDSPRAKNELFVRLSATGTHEVVIETPKHITDLAALGEMDIERILQAYRERTLSLRSDPRWRYVLIYKNQGTEAGATLQHSHSQIAALPMVPKEPLEEFAAAEKHYAAAGRCIYCTIIESERENGARMIAENSEFLVFCPFASRVAGETWILPKRHISSFDSQNADLSALARALGDLLKRLDLRFDRPAFNYFIRSNPLREPENPYYHWHLEILPKLQYVAGFEWGSGVFMNSLAPEDAARLLRGSGSCGSAAN